MKTDSLSWAALTVLSLLASPTECRPQDVQQPRGSVVEMVNMGKRWVNPHILMNQTYAKFGKQAPEQIVRAAEKAARAMEHNNLVKRAKPNAKPKSKKVPTVKKMGIQEISGFAEIEYLLPVTVGSKTLYMEVDTADQQTWAFSTLLPEEEQGSHNLYDPGNKPPIKEWQSFYHVEPEGGNRGYAYGQPYADKVVMGGFTATSAHVGAATTVAENLRNHASDGSVGMALDRAYCEGYCDSFLRSKPFNAGTYLQKFGLDLKHTGVSTWEFGNYDSVTYPFKKQSWASVIMSISEVPGYNKEGRWLIEGGDCFFNKQKVNCGHDLVVASATPLIILPSATVQNYYNRVPGAYYDEETYTWTVPCNANLPSLGFNFDPLNHPEGNHTPGSYLNLGELNDGSGRCFPALQRSIYSDLNVLGTSFLKSQYVGFEAYLEKGHVSGGVVMFSPKAV